MCSVFRICEFGREEMNRRVGNGMVSESGLSVGDVSGSVNERPTSMKSCFLLCLHTKPPCGLALCPVRAAVV